MKTVEELQNLLAEKEKELNGCKDLANTQYKKWVERNEALQSELEAVKKDNEDTINKWNELCIICDELKSQAEKMAEAIQEYLDADGSITQKNMQETLSHYKLTVPTKD